jgi:anti-sigma factor ChrR (cupin superfamily)
MAEAARPSDPRYHTTNAAALPWKASADVAGVEVKDLGMADGLAMQLVRCRAGVTFPAHRHAGPEFIYVLDGTVIHDEQRLGPGWARVAESGTLDVQFRSETGCVFLLVYGESPPEGR